ncbi:MAG: rhomboid family intramembrane serine protease [Fervidicoccaceae archaeon]
MENDLIPAGDENLEVERPVVNQLLILINVGVFLAMYFWPKLFLPGATSIDDIINAYGFKPYFLVKGENLWTIFTAMFIHADFAHILGNMLYLYIFGDNIEAALGKLRYLVFYFLSGIGAVIFHVFSVWVSVDLSPLAAYGSLNNPWLVPAVGASGAISGVLGAYLIMYPAGTVRAVGLWFVVPILFKIPAIAFIGFWFIYQLVLAFFSILGPYVGIAFWAHVGGFITGIALVPILADKNRIKMLKVLASTRRYITLE